MEIVDHFGLDPYLFGAQVINFLIIFYLLKRFLYKPVLEILRKREKEIAEGLKQAEEGKILLEKAQEKEKEILVKARGEAKEIIEEAKNQGLTLGKQIEDNAKIEAQRIILEAQSQIEENRKETEKKLVSQVSSISIEYLKRALSNIFSESEQKEILQKAVKTIGKPS